jgi:hypothetical protein
MVLESVQDQEAWGASRQGIGGPSNRSWLKAYLIQKDGAGYGKTMY